MVRNVLEHQIKTNAHTRSQAALSNFRATLPEGGQQLTKDPYVLDLLALALDSDAKERHPAQSLVDGIVDTLHDLGEGFAFVGRQVHFEVDSDDFSQRHLVGRAPGRATPALLELQRPKRFSTRQTITLESPSAFSTGNMRRSRSNVGQHDNDYFDQSRELPWYQPFDLHL